MPAKNWRGKSHPGLLWRMAYGRNGATRPALRKAWQQWKDRLFAPKPFQVMVYSPKTGKPQVQWVQLNQKTGKIEPTKSPATKKRKPAAKKTTSRRTASQPSKASKPSRASKSGGTQRRQPAANAATPRRRSPETMSDRYLQNPDGTMNGSRKQKPVTYAQAQREYSKAMKNAEAASKRAEELLGWDQPRGRRPATRKGDRPS